MLGGYRLQGDHPGLVQEFLGRLGATGVGDASIVKTATVLQSILNRAVIEGLAERNPVAVVRKPPQRRKREPDLVSPVTVERIRANLRGTRRDARLAARLRRPAPGERRP